MMFIDALEQFIELIKSDKELNEWYLSNFIDKHIDLLSTSDAYTFSSLVLSFISDNSNSEILYELISISIALQRQSESTQIPFILISCPNILNDVMKNESDPYLNELVRTLNQAYRIH